MAKGLDWFRFYVAVLNCAKVQQLSDRQFRGWVNILCVAREHEGVLPELNDLAFKLRMRPIDAGVLTQALVKARLLDQRPDGRYIPHDWSEHQYVSDNSTDRVKKYREGLSRGGSNPNEFAKLRPEVLKRDGLNCVYCLSTERIVIDHVVPVSQGGPTRVENLVAACKRCNAGKAGRTPTQARIKVTAPHARDIVSLAEKMYVTHVTVTETPSDTDTDTDTEQTQTQTPEAGVRATITDHETGWDFLRQAWGANPNLMGPSVPDWNDALHEWRRLDLDAKRDAHRYLPTIDGGNPARLATPASYLRKRMFTRDIRPATSPTAKPLSPAHARLAEMLKEAGSGEA